MALLLRLPLLLLLPRAIVGAVIHSSEPPAPLLLRNSAEANRRRVAEDGGGGDNCEDLTMRSQEVSTACGCSDSSTTCYNTGVPKTCPASCAQILESFAADCRSQLVTMQAGVASELVSELDASIALCSAGATIECGGTSDLYTLNLQQEPVAFAQAICCDQMEESCNLGRELKECVSFECSSAVRQVSTACHDYLTSPINSKFLQVYTQMLANDEALCESTFPEQVFAITNQVDDVVSSCQGLLIDGRYQYTGSFEDNVLITAPSGQHVRLDVRSLWQPVGSFVEIIDGASNDDWQL